MKMYHPVHTRVPWTGTDPIYSEMSPILKTVENSNFNHFSHNPMNTRVHHVQKNIIFKIPGFYFYVKLNFRNILLNRFFDWRPLYCGNFCFSKFREQQGKFSLISSFLYTISWSRSPKLSKTFLNPPTHNPLSYIPTYI